MCESLLVYIARKPIFRRRTFTSKLLEIPSRPHYAFGGSFSQTSHQICVSTGNIELQTVFCTNSTTNSCEISPSFKTTVGCFSVAWLRFQICVHFSLQLVIFELYIYCWRYITDIPGNTQSFSNYSNIRQVFLS